MVSGGVEALRLQAPCIFQKVLVKMC